MTTGKYANFSDQDLVHEIKRLKEKKKRALRAVDVAGIERDLKIITHILERRRKR
ncbi:hypothetical protein SEA_PHREDRICK_128 [Streptomyces phage Phredrick]|nr:hypothetical protein SEA_KENREY_131 [Streptomyces phage Kenrey]WNN94700.1 hypothetical protein SEA_PHREDRICK_128 [Streptomyces phage Phredrick]